MFLLSYIYLLIPLGQVFLKLLKIMDHHSAVCADSVGIVKLLIAEAFSSPLLHPVPEPEHMPVWDIEFFVFPGKKDNKKRNTALLFKFTHEFHLVLMNVVKREGVGSTLLSIKAYRNSLDNTYIVDGTFFVEISQCDMIVFLVHIDRGYGRRNLLYKRKLLFTIPVITLIYQLFKR